MEMVSPCPFEHFETTLQFFFYKMNTYSKDVSCLPGIVVGTRDTAVNKIQKAIPVAIKKNK